LSVSPRSQFPLESAQEDELDSGIALLTSGTPTKAMPRGTEPEGHVSRSSPAANQQGQPSQPSHITASQLCDEPMAIIDKGMQERDRKAPKIPQAVIEVEEENKQTSGSEEEPVNIPASGINDAQQSPDLDLDDQLASVVGGDSLSDNHDAKEPFHGSGDVYRSSDPNDGLGRDVDDILTNDIEHDIGENASEQGGQHEDSTEGQDHQSVQTATTHPSMTPQERTWWAMSFEELYQHAKSKNFGKTGSEGRHSGRIRIIKWLCEKEGILPYVASSITPVVETTPIIARPTLLPTGAISHPEAILRTSDPALQRLIDEAEKKYQQWPPADLLALAMQRSYQLLKDSKGKLPSKSTSAMAKWLAAWDVLKSPREKKWWLGDGIDLVNRAKAMGYQGPSRKYEVIVWLRSTAEESEVAVTEVAEPTPNKIHMKRTAKEAAQPVSKRPAKGSKRPHGWHVLKSS
jgi:hypothetical protein